MKEIINNQEETANSEEFFNYEAKDLFEVVFKDFETGVEVCYPGKIGRVMSSLASVYLSLLSVDGVEVDHYDKEHDIIFLKNTYDGHELMVFERKEELMDQVVDKQNIMNKGFVPIARFRNINAYDDFIKKYCGIVTDENFYRFHTRHKRYAERGWLSYLREFLGVEFLEGRLFDLTEHVEGYIFNNDLKKKTLNEFDKYEKFYEVTESVRLARQAIMKVEFRPTTKGKKEVENGHT